MMLPVGDGTWITFVVVAFRFTFLANKAVAKTKNVVSTGDKALVEDQF